MKTEAVLFDLDGTLLNTIDDLADSMNQVLRENNFPEHETEKYCLFVGNGAKKLVERALPEDQREESEIDKYHIRYRELYGKCWKNKTSLYEGIEDLLTRLRILNIPIAILSNKPHGDVLRVTNFFFEDDLFSVISGQKDHIPHKPAPDGIYLITDELKVNCEKCLFVGDSSVDMKTAGAARMKAVGVSWGFRSTEELIENGADYIINEPGELLSLL